MKDIMDWSKCLNEFIMDVELDNDKIESLKDTAKARIRFISSIKISEDNVSFIVENYYEVIKELLTAILLKSKMKSSNHQCLISFFYNQYKEYEEESNIILQMSYLRNRLTYYGELIPYKYYERYKLEFKHIIQLLLDITNKK